MTTAGDIISIHACPLRRSARRKAALPGLRLARFALFADGAHEPDIVPYQKRLQAFQILVQRLLFLHAALDLLPLLVLAVYLRLEREGQRKETRGLLAPVSAAELQDGGGRGAVRAGGELLVRQFRRPPTPSETVSRMDVDSLERLFLWSAAEIL